MAKHIGIDKILIPYATNRKAASLIVVVPANIWAIVIQSPVPGTETIVLARRPKGAVVSYTVVTTIIVATVTSRKSSKA